MKIVYVDIQYDYGIKERGRNYIGQDGFKNALESLGHDVVPFYYDEYLENIEPLQSKLLDFVDSIKPDLVFFIIFRDHFKVETLDALKSKYKTVNWFGDDTWRFDSYTKKYAPHFSHCITTDKFSIEKYNKLGVENIFYSQWAAIQSFNVPEVTDYKYDVTFIGAKHPHRKWFTDQLRKKGISVECFGFGWDNGPLTNTEMNNVFASSKISLNLSNSSCYDLRYLISSPINIAYTIKSSKSMSQIKARNFEIPFYKGFQLTDYVPTIEKYFDIGKEVVCFNTLEEAVELIRYYLKNNEEREKIKRDGHLKAQSTHGYNHRLKAFFEEYFS